jgi:hypothetical protein
VRRESKKGYGSQVYKREVGRRREEKRGGHGLGRGDPTLLGGGRDGMGVILSLR